MANLRAKASFSQIERWRRKQQRQGGRMGVVVLAKAEGLDLKGTVLGGRGSGEALGIVVSCDGNQRGRRAP